MSLPLVAVMMAMDMIAIVVAMSPPVAPCTEVMVHMDLLLVNLLPTSALDLMTAAANFPLKSINTIPMATALLWKRVAFFLLLRVKYELQGKNLCLCGFLYNKLNLSGYKKSPKTSGKKNI